MSTSPHRPAAWIVLNVLAIGLAVGPAHGQRPQQPSGMAGLAPVRPAAPSGGMHGFGGVRSAPPSFGNRTIPVSNRAVGLPPANRTVPLPTGTSFTGGHAGLSHGTLAPRPFGGERGFSEGAGFTANGSINSGDFRARFHVGSGFDGTGHFHGDHRHHHHGGHYDSFLNYPLFYNPWWYGTGYSYGTIDGYYAPADPFLATSYTPAPGAPAPAPVTEHVTPSSAKDLGATYLMAGGAKDAVTTLRTWLRDNPGDAEAMRLLAVALVETGSISDAAATISLAYHTDPALAARPVAPEIFGGSGERARNDVRRASVYANRVKSASAWLLVAVLMQAEGRDHIARPIVEKAKAAGLESAVADRLLAAMR